MASERRCNFKFGMTVGEIISIISIVIIGTAAVVRFEYGITDVKAANLRTDERHLKDVEEIKREYREDTKEIKRDIKRILRQLK